MSKKANAKMPSLRDLINCVPRLNSFDKQAIDEKY